MGSSYSPTKPSLPEWREDATEAKATPTNTRQRSVRLLLLLLLVILPTLLVPCHRMHPNLRLKHDTRTYAFVGSAGVQCEEVLATCLLHVTQRRCFHFDVVVAMILYNVRRMLVVHVKALQQCLQFGRSHAGKRTAVTLVP